MAIDRRAALQLGLIALAVPMQYLLSTYILPSSQESRTSAINELVKRLVRIKTDYLTGAAWRAWAAELVAAIDNKKPPQETPSLMQNGESPALEVIKYRDPKGYFAGGLTPRSPRQPHVRFRVGQVIRHKKWGYRGIIIGWDLSAKASDDWLRQMHPSDKPHWRHQPNYAILVDTRDRLTPQTTYVPEENLQVQTNVKVIHPEVDDYFEFFDGAQYLPRPWVKIIYPHD